MRLHISILRRNLTHLAVSITSIRPILTILCQFQYFMRYCTIACSAYRAIMLKLELTAATAHSFGFRSAITFNIRCKKKHLKISFPYPENSQSVSSYRRLTHVFHETFRNMMTVCTTYRKGNKLFPPVFFSSIGNFVL